MKLTTKLKFFGMFATALVIVLGVVTYWRFSQTELAIAGNAVAGNIVRDAFTLNVLTDDYIRTHGERAQIQWQSQHARLNQSITSYAIENPSEQQLVQHLLHEQKASLLHFVDLQEIVKKQADGTLDPQELSLLQDAAKRLNGQLSVDMQTIVADASTLAQMNSTRLQVIRQTTNTLILSLIIFLGISLLLPYLLFARGISRSVKALTDGTLALSGGNLGFRLAIKSDDEFGQLAKSFNDMASQLAQLDHAKDEFIVLASHELRTPITAARGFISMILKGSYGEVNERLKKPLLRISDVTDRQVHLINDLLDVSRLQTGTIPYSLTDFSLTEDVNEVIESLQPIGQQKGVSLALARSDRVMVHADSDWVKQILGNIIGNALKFTKKGRITVSYAYPSDGLVHIVVADTGIGVSREDKKKLFRKFQQIGSKELGKPDGTGLGLYISREIARKMGGDVWLEKSESGKGSVFIFSVPKARDNE